MEASPGRKVELASVCAVGDLRNAMNVSLDAFIDTRHWETGRKAAFKALFGEAIDEAIERLEPKLAVGGVAYADAPKPAVAYAAPDGERIAELLRVQEARDVLLVEVSEARAAALKKRIALFKQSKDMDDAYVAALDARVAAQMTAGASDVVAADAARKEALLAEAHQVRALCMGLVKDLPMAADRIERQLSVD